MTQYCYLLQVGVPLRVLRVWGHSAAITYVAAPVTVALEYPHSTVKVTQPAEATVILYFMRAT